MKISAPIALAFATALNTSAMAETTIATNLPEIVDLTPKDHIDLDVPNQSKAIQCAVQAVSEANIPNSELGVEKRVYPKQDDDSEAYSDYNIGRSRAAIFPKKGAEGMTLNYEKPNAIEIPGYTMHNISVGISMAADQKYIHFEAFHAGSYNDTVDAVNVDIVGKITPTGLTERNGGAVQQSSEWGADLRDPMKSEHGRWAVSAAQAVEHRWNLCMGFNSTNRPATAATVELPTPYKQGVPESTIPQLNR